MKKRNERARGSFQQREDIEFLLGLLAAKDEAHERDAAKLLNALNEQTGRGNDLAYKCTALEKSCSEKDAEIEGLKGMKFSDRNWRALKSRAEVAETKVEAKDEEIARLQSRVMELEGKLASDIVNLWVQRAIFLMTIIWAVSRK